MNSHVVKPVVAVKPVVMNNKCEPNPETGLNLMGR